MKSIMADWPIYTLQRIQGHTGFCQSSHNLHLKLLEA